MPTGTRPLPSPLSQEVGRILSNEISSRALSQARVAETAEISAAQLSRALAGKKVFTLDQLDAVCTAVGVDLIEVIAAADKKTRQAPANVTPLRNVPTSRDTIDHVDTPDLEHLDYAASRGTRKADEAPYAE